MSVLPGLDASDAIVIERVHTAPAMTQVCPLTCLPVGDTDNRVFLKDLLDTLSPDLLHFFHDEFTDNLRSRLDAVANESFCVQLQGCRHTYGAVPFLFHVLSSEFKCPLCRHGSAKTVEIFDKRVHSCSKSSDKQLADAHARFCDDAKFPHDMWQCLCDVALVFREKRKREKIEEDIASLLEAQPYEVVRVQEMTPEELMSDLSISVVFSFFTKASDTRRSPFSTRNFAVSLNPSNIARERNQVQLTYRSGRSLRQLSTMLRRSSKFSIMLFAQSDYESCTFFESPCLQKPIVLSGDDGFENVQTIVSTTDSHGAVTLRWDKCPVSNVLLLNSISYTTRCEDIRTLAMQTMLVI